MKKTSELDDELQPASKERPDKQKVVGEEFSDDQLLELMNHPLPEFGQPDFGVVIRAYRGLPIEAFERFLTLYKEQGKSLEVKDKNGRSLLEYLKRFTAQLEYADAVLRHLS
ncbi:MAG: PA4642 family protein [Pseudomonadota bacterium]